MAQLLVKARDGENQGRFMLGDVVVVKDDSHAWGKEECLEQWIASGGDGKLFPGHFTIVKVPGEPVASYVKHLEASSEARRAHYLDMTKLPSPSDPSSSTIVSTHSEVMNATVKKPTPKGPPK